MTPCRRACLVSSIFNQTATILRIGTPLLVEIIGRNGITTTLSPADPSKDRFGSSATKSASTPVYDTETRKIATYKCRVTGNATPRDQITADANTARCEWRVLLPLSADVRVEDRIKVGPLTYEVIDTDAGRADASFLTAFCRSEKP